MAVVLCSVFGAGAQFFTQQGVVLVGGKLNTYVAGSVSTPVATYTDSTGSVQNANPIILDSGGRLTQEIWLTAGTRVKFVLTDSTSASVGPTIDNIPGVNDVSTGASVSIWAASGVVPSYVNATQFSLVGDQTALFPVASRVRYTVTAGVFYGTVSASVYAPSTTTVTVSPDSSVLDSGLSAVAISPITIVGSPAGAGAIVFNPTITQPPSSLGAFVQSLGKTTTTGGTSTAFTLTPANVITSYITGSVFLVTFNQASGAAPTLNISGQGAKNLKQYDNSGNKIAATLYSGQVTQVGYDGTDMVVLNPVKSGSTLIRVTPFSSSGTWTKLAGVTTVSVEVIGGGGGAFIGAGGGGGGGAAYAKKFVSAPGASEVVTVGSGGAFGTPGGSGGASSFGSWASAGGGGPGAATTGGSGNNGGTSTGDIVIPGAGGGWGANSSNYYFGQGGNSAIGGGAAGDVSTGGAATIVGKSGANGTGGGGSGGTATGGYGGTGFVIVSEYG
jgi:hypothetical protein